MSVQPGGAQQNPSVLALVEQQLELGAAEDRALSAVLRESIDDALEPPAVNARR